MITLLLGAGASKPFGYPTTQDFMDVANERFNSLLYNEVNGFLKNNNNVVDIEMVLWELQKLHKCLDDMQEPDTFKKWFFISSGRLAHQINAGQYQPLTSMLPNTATEINDLISRINKLVYDTYWKPPSANNFYHAFFGLLRTFYNSVDSPINIFTTNYDRVIENNFIDTEPEEFNDGFLYYHRKHELWDISHYGNSFINLYKLHGSIDWKRLEDKRVYRVPVSNFTKHKDHVILYPGFKGEPDEEPFIAIHQEFKKSLLASNVCLAIGYSFRDEHINSIIADAVSQTKLEMIVWNPMKPTMNISLDRVTFLLKNFGEKLSDMNDILHIFGGEVMQ